MQSRLPPRVAPFALAVVTLALGGCGAHLPPPRVATPTAPTGRPTSDEQYAPLRSIYDATDAGDPHRASLRASLEAWLLDQAEGELKAQRSEAALVQLRQALTLWDVSELAGPVHDERLAQTVRALDSAMRRRGAHGPVLLALAVERSLETPDAQSPKQRWAELRDWLLTAGDEPERGRRALIDDLESVVSAWPAPFVVDELHAQYVALMHPDLGGGRQDLAELFLTHNVEVVADRVAALYLRVGRLDEGIAALRELNAVDAGARDLLRLLEAYAAKDAPPELMLKVAARFARSQSTDGLTIAERVCRDGEKRFPRAVDPYLCVGQIALKRFSFDLAARSEEQALALDPARRDTWEDLARAYEGRLFMLAGDDSLGDVGPELERVRAFHERAKARFPKAPINPSFASALVEVARGRFNAGHPDEAARYCERSLALEPTPMAIDQLGLLAVKRGDAKTAIDLYRKGLASIPDGPGDLQRYWRAKFHGALGDALELAGEAAAAQKSRLDALASWNALLQSRQPPEAMGEGELERGKLLYHLGARDQAMRAFEDALDAAPERASSYADELAFLVPRAEREEALEIYHRACARDDVSEYIKVYASLWIVDLDRRAGEPEDPLARALLDGVDGAKWYAELARWATGRESDRDLEAHGDTPSKRAESLFYRAMRLAEQGKPDEARQLWQQVLDTKMMSFFEYEMAAYYLKHGAAATPPKPIAKPPAPTDKAVPDDSI